VRGLLFIGVLGLLFSCNQTTTKAQEGEATNEVYVIDTSLPLEQRIKLTDLEGNDVDLQSFKGKTIFLNFWATWCKPCIKEMPSIERARVQLEPQGFVFLAASDESLKRILKFSKKIPHEFQIVRLEGDIFDLDVKALPTTFIIDGSGKIIFNEIGAREWDDEANIDMLLALSNK
jgi:thiol-disulfide isomerase/thioredoxin